ncbi:YxeA family protein [Ferdinandcohnia quinoae]|uniref:YxeA family protein n=1 Tax=Fredinandcohnia quinoae TaxID=2918902 RepID=A0AAW5E0J4_9BACI|nr:YxeA family protein [Fredinandcohnia sp. SECRCQ15]MCH1626430.1 YxeA family protein [Fredinandcohnia sp. SECRCQ15]
MKKAIAVVILILVGIGAFLIKGGVIIDRINPFVKVDEYYTIVDTKGKHLGKDSIRKNKESYEYQFIGYNVEGKKQEVTIKVTKDLRIGAYLKITAKGQNGKSWTEVQPDEIPEKVKKKLS